MEKYNILLTKSNPDMVHQKFVEYGLDRFATIGMSLNKNKKYVVQLKSNGKKIHFGDIRYQDYTFHLDEIRRDNFRSRNHKWSDAEVFTPMWCSYYLLW
jgi:hypothetical protein